MRQPKPTTALVLTHGGAANDPAVADGCERACDAAIAVLANGQGALDAAIAAVIVLEDDERMNAGTGSTLRLDGSIQTDASVMDARGFGAVVRNERTDGQSPIAVPYAYLPPFDTTHLLGAVGQVHLPWGFRLGARYRVATGMPREDVAGAVFDADTGRYQQVWGPRGGARFPVFQALDLRVDWTTVFDWFELDLYADLVNINTLFGRPVEGTLYNFDYSETAPRYGLPLIPTIGAKATF